MPENPSDDYILQEDPKGIPFAKAIRNALVRGTLASLRSSVVASFYRPGLRLEENVTGCESLIETVMALKQ